MESSRGHGKRSLNIKIEEEEEEEEEDEDEEEEEDEDGSRSSSSSFNNSNNSEDERRKRVMMKSNNSSSTPAGNKRGSGAGGSTVGSRPCCQADSCNADLSDLKQYYRRHKVCDFHSKAPAVLVAGLHQRFCQQCSKFHNLSEFDDSKRSCRRRLAGHNERRRKATYQGEVPT